MTSLFFNFLARDNQFRKPLNLVLDNNNEIKVDWKNHNLTNVYLYYYILSYTFSVEKYIIGYSTVTEYQMENMFDNI